MHGTCYRYIEDVHEDDAAIIFFKNLQGFDLHIAGGILSALLAANFLFVQMMTLE